MPRILKLLLSLAFFLFSTSCCKETAAIGDGNWISRSGFRGLSRSEGASFVIGDYAYVSTGYNSSGKRLNDLWQYDPQKEEWNQKANFPGVPRNSAIGLTIGNIGYLGTGYDGKNILKDFWSYDAFSNSWNQKADFAGSPRYDAVAFAIENYGYIGTGYDGISSLKDFWQYNPTNDSWIQRMGTKLIPRYAAVTFVYHNKGYIVTGMNGGTAVTDFWVFDPSKADSSAWQPLRSIANVSAENYDDSYLTIARGNATALTSLGGSASGKAYISTGDLISLNSYTWEYDFATDLWKQKTSFEGTERTGAIGFTVNNRGFVGLGRNANYDFADIREFHPFELYNFND